MVANLVGGVPGSMRAVLGTGGRRASIADAGQLTVAVAWTFPLEQTRGAFELGQDGDVCGRFAIRVR